MADIRPISQLGNPVLRQVAQPIHNLGEPSLQVLIDDLTATLRQAGGVGIAAPQVGISKRVLIVASHPNARYPDAPEMEPTAMINPHLLDHSDCTTQDWEGCLSIPGIRGLVPRYDHIEVAYIDHQGVLQRRDLSGFVARIFQHEFDHLDGYVFLDRVESIRDLVSELEYLRIIASQPT